VWSVCVSIHSCLEVHPKSCLLRIGHLVEMALSSLSRFSSIEIETETNPVHPSRVRNITSTYIDTG